MGTLNRSSGLRPVEDPPNDADALDVVLHYTRAYESEFARARGVVKRRATYTVVTQSGITGLIAVVGATVSVTGWTWLGIVSAGLAALIGIIASWEAHFRHRELWRQRSLVLGELQALKRRLLFEVAATHDRHELAAWGREELERILAADLTSWAELRRRTSTQGEVGQGAEPETPQVPAA